MSEERSRRLIEKLASDAAPVKRFPRLRALVAASLGAWAAVASIVWIAAGPRSDLSTVAAADPAYSAVLIGLVLAAIGGTLATFAASVPGREEVRLGALTAAVGGLTIAAIVCLRSSTSGVVNDPALDLACIANSTLFALPLVAVAAWFAARGWIQEPARVAVLTLLGAVAMGAFIVHLICPAGQSSHFLVGHLGAAPVLAILAALPLAWLLRKAID